MAKEYIEREAAIEALENIAKSYYKSRLVYFRTICAAINTALCKVQSVPAADVRPVVRGRWVQGEYRPYCSNCDGYPPTRKRLGHPGDTEFDYTKFCPDCGADMREVDDG